MTSWSSFATRHADDERKVVSNIVAIVLLALFVVVVVLGLATPKAVREPAPRASASRPIAAPPRAESDVKALESAAVDLQAQAVEIEKASAKIRSR